MQLLHKHTRYQLHGRGLKRHRTRPLFTCCLISPPTSKGGWLLFEGGLSSRKYSMWICTHVRVFVHETPSPLHVHWRQSVHLMISESNGSLCKYMWVWPSNAQSPSRKVGLPFLHCALNAWPGEGSNHCNSVSTCTFTCSHTLVPYVKVAPVPPLSPLCQPAQPYSCEYCNWNRMAPNFQGA